MIATDQNVNWMWILFLPIVACSQITNKLRVLLLIERYLLILIEFKILIQPFVFTIKSDWWVSVATRHYVNSSSDLLVTGISTWIIIYKPSNKILMVALHQNDFNSNKTYKIPRPKAYNDILSWIFLPISFFLQTSASKLGSFEFVQS